MANLGPASVSSVHPQVLGSNQAIRLLGVAKGLNFSATGDTVLPIINSTSYAISNVVISNASTALSSAAAGLFYAPSAAGTAIVASNTLTLALSTILQATVATATTIQTSQNLYYNVATAQGSGITGDVYVYGYDLS